MSTIIISAAFGGLVATAITLDPGSVFLPLSVVGSIVAAVWWHGRKLQRIDDRLESLEEKIADLPCKKDGTGCSERKGKS